MTWKTEQAGRLVSKHQIGAVNDNAFDTDHKSVRLASIDGAQIGMIMRPQTQEIGPQRRRERRSCREPHGQFLGRPYRGDSSDAVGLKYQVFLLPEQAAPKRSCADRRSFDRHALTGASMRSKVLHMDVVDSRSGSVRHARARLFIFGAACLALVASAAASPAVPPVDNKIVMELRRLEPGHAVILGQARVIGPFNATALEYDLDKTGPRARNFSRKMVWAADRERALFLGANHAVPHRLNDVWEFDLPSLSWHLLYAPDHSRSTKGLGSNASDVVFRDGWLVTQRGGPAVIGHGWWGLTYDPVRRELLFMNRWGATDHDAAVRRVGGDPSLRYTGPPLWKFSPSRHEWTAQKTPPPHPAAPYGAMLEYVPELAGAVWHMNNWSMRATWLYDPDRRAWRKLAANQPTGQFRQEAPGRELIGYHDPKRKLIVAQHGKSTFHFDTVYRSWRRVIAGKADDERFPTGHGARSVFHYDSASRHGLLVDLENFVLWAYDPDSLEWTRVNPRGDSMPRQPRMLAYVDHAQGVLVVINDRLVWAYRHGP